VASLREEYRQRVNAPGQELGSDHGAKDDPRRRLRLELLRAERRALIRLRNEGIISDEVLHHLERELDVEALRIGAGDAR
jgi:CPA1 family monovalent cation:H+ antiporter